MEWKGGHLGRPCFLTELTSCRLATWEVTVSPGLIFPVGNQGICAAPTSWDC